MDSKNLASYRYFIIFILITFLEVLFCTFVYGATPEISSIEPNWGRPDQETNIVIKGSNFESGVKAALYGGGPFVKGSASTLSLTWNVFTSENFAYVATSKGLEIFDISNPGNPTKVANCNIPGTRDVFVSGEFAYVAASSAGLKVVDIGSVITNPPAVLELTVLGEYDTPYSAEGIYVAGKYAYVADGGSGLQILDISDPTSPVKTDSYNTPGLAYGVSVAGDYAYVADDLSGLQILDVSDPANILYKGTYDTPGRAYRVAVKGNYAYVADYDEGLQIINVSKPDNPSFAGACNKIKYAEDVYVDNNYAYVAGSGPGFSVVDIADPANPVIINSVDTITGTGIHFSGKFAYMTAGSGLLAIDVTISDNPSITGVYDALELATAVAVSGSYAYAASADSGLHIINIADPANPSFVGACSIPDAVVHNIYVAGNYAYVADGVNGLRIIDITNPAAPYIADTLDTPGTAYDVYVVGNYAYVADDSEGLHVVDIFNAAGPTIVGSELSTQTTTSFRRVHVAGDYAFVLDYQTAVLYKINIALPESPNVIGWCLVDFAGDIFVDGNYAYIATGGYGLQVVSITGTLSVIGEVDTPGMAYGVYVVGDYAYVATSYAGIQVVDVSTPSSPILVGACNTSGYAGDVKVTDSNIFVADGVMGLQILEPFSLCTDVNLIDSETVSAAVPAGYPIGGYDMYLVNPGGEMDILNNGYVVSFTPPNQPMRPSFAGPLLLLLLGD